MVATPAMRQAFPDWIDRDAIVAHATNELRAAMERGVRTMVDLTPINLGRDITVIRGIISGRDFSGL